MNGKRVIAVLVLILMVGIISSCSEGGASTENHALSGSWTMTTTPDSSTDSVGSGSFALTFLSDIFGDLYIGTGTLSGGTIDGDYSVSGWDLGSGYVSFSFSIENVDMDGDDFDDSISFSGIMSGNTVVGTYSGDPGTAYDGLSGDFIATKN